LSLVWAQGGVEAIPPQTKKREEHPVQTVKDAMTKGAITCRLDTSLEQAAREMRDGGVGSLIAVEQGAIRGIITDRDIVTRAIADGARLSETTVNDVCTHEVATIKPHESVEQAAALAHSRHVRRLPVVEDGSPIGVISLHDMGAAA
jgi:CBS domain-containing protein